MLPSVTIITPTTDSRASFLNRLAEMVSTQDYKGDLQWLVNYEDYPIGTKRNILSEAAKGEMIVAMDSDDLYEFDYVSKVVDHLLKSGAQITGLSSAYFYDISGQLYHWTSKHAQPYVIEATMCYYRSMWAKNHFPDTSDGEGMLFLSNAGLIVPHNYKDGFTAIIHGTNTHCHNSKCFFTEIPFADAPDILRKYY